MAKTSTQSFKTDRNTNVSTSDLEEDVRQLRADIARLVDHLTVLGKEAGPSARRAAGDGMDQLRAQSKETLKNIRRSAQEVGHEASGAVRERPFTSLAIAGGVGFLLALLTRR